MTDSPTPEQLDVLRDKVVSLVVTLRSRAAVDRATAALGLDRQEADELIADAYAAILVAALVDKRSAYGENLIRLNNLYAEAVAAGELGTALAVQKELAKLLDLYHYRLPPAQPEPESDEPTAHPDSLEGIRLRLA